MPLSKDALIFGFGFLNGARCRLSFGGEGATRQITPRAQAALDELLAAGYAEAVDPEESIRGRLAYRGLDRDPPLGQLVREACIDPFHLESWPAFEKIKDGREA